MVKCSQVNSLLLLFILFQMARTAQTLLNEVTFSNPFQVEIGYDEKFISSRIVRQADNGQPFPSPLPPFRNSDKAQKIKRQIKIGNGYSLPPPFLHPYMKKNHGNGNLAGLGRNVPHRKRIVRHADNGESFSSPLNLFHKSEKALKIKTQIKIGNGYSLPPPFLHPYMKKNHGNGKNGNLAGLGRNVPHRKRIVRHADNGQSFPSPLPLFRNSDKKQKIKRQINWTNQII